MAKLKLVWENNPDTPLSAVNLSKFVSHSTDDGERILYVDEPSVYPNGDGRLKIRANSKISFAVPQTNAFFRFEESLVSHNSKYIPATTRGLTYRIESPYTDSKSLAFDEASSNLTNDSNWQEIENGSSTATFYTGDDPSSGAGFITLDVDGSASRVEAHQTVSFTNGNTVSISFYYKGEGGRFIVEGDPNSAVKYWVDEILTQQWEVGEHVYILPAASEWTRFDLPNIETTSLIDGEIKLRFFSNIADSEVTAGAFQLEELDYASSYMFPGTSRDASQFVLPGDIIDTEEGTVDITVRVDSFINDNIIFVAKTTSDDAIKCYFDVSAEQIILEVFDTDSSTVQSIFLPVSLNDIREEFIRIFACWKSDYGLKISINSLGSTQSNTLTTTYTPFSVDEITGVHIGGEYNGSSSSNLLRGMIDSLKFNFLFKSVQEIDNDLLVEPYPEENDYKFFEAESENIFLDASFLDIGSSFDPTTKYFVWVCDDRNEDTASIVISKSDFQPQGCKRYFSRMLGSFTTDGSSNPDAFSVWDVSTYFSDVLHTNRFVLGGINVATPDIEFRKPPFGSVNDATFNIPTHFEDHIYAGSFMDIDPAGIFNFDNVRINGSEITTIGADTDLNLTANGSGNVVIDSNNIQFLSQSGTIQLDDVRIKDNKIYSSTGNDLIIRNDEATTNVVIEATAGTVQINAQNIDFNAGSGSLDLDLIRIEQNTISAPGDDLIITATDDVELQSGTGEVHIDDLKVKDNTLFNDVGDLNIEAIGHSINLTGQSINFDASAGGLGLEDLRIDGNRLYSTPSFDLVIETGDPTRDVRLNSPGTGSVYINDVKFDNNKIYTDSSTNLIINADASNSVVFTGNNVKLETQLTADDENIRFIDSNTAVTNAQGHQAGYGLNIYPEASRGAGDAVFTVSDNSQAKQFEVLSGSGVRIGQSGTLQYNQASPTGTEVLGYNGYFYANKVYNAVYNDLAECWSKDPHSKVEYGQVVVRNFALGVEPSTKRAQRNVVGVVSKDFGYLLGAEDYNEDLSLSSKVPIAISGRVKVKIRPKDRKGLKYGDEFVSWKNGMVAKANWFERVFKRAAIVGKMVDISPSEDSIIIKV